MRIHTIVKYISFLFLPIKQNQWLFTSFGGYYNDSPKALSEKVREMYPNIQIYWSVKEEKKGLLPSYAKYVEFGTDEYRKVRSQSKVIVDNVYADKAFTIYKHQIINNLRKRVIMRLSHKNGKKCYSLWHGTPMKRIGRYQYGNDDIVDMLVDKNLTMIVGNEFTNIMMKNVAFGKLKVKSLGMARNDALFSTGNKENIGVSKEKKIILFAPTFRNDGKDVEGKNLQRSGLDQLNSIDFEKLFACLENKFGGDWVFVCRFHYHVSSIVDWDSLNKKYNGKIINGNAKDDMAEYLSCADILVTDASSSMIDYALTGKPCFLFFPDLENYSNRERGLPLDINELPFPISKTFDSLIGSINSFDENKYTEDVKKFLQKIGNVDDGHAAARIAKYIYEDK